MTIKIISTKGPSEANLQAVEREELILAAAKMVTAASGSSDPANLERCASKIRSRTATLGKGAIDRLAIDVSKNIARFDASTAMLHSMDLDIERVMQLLEG